MNNNVLAAAAGSASAIIFMAPFWGGPLGIVLTYSAPFPLFAAGLGLGSRAVIIAAGAGLVTMMLIGGTSAPNSLALTALYAALHAFPVGLVVHQALMKKPSAEHGDPEAWFPLGGMIATLAVLGAVGAAGIALSIGGGSDMSARLSELLISAMEVAAPTLPAADQQALADTLAASFLGISAVMWITMMVINGALAQTLLTRRSRNIRPRPNWSAITLPGWVSWPLVISAAAALLGDGNIEYVARNLVIVFAAPFFFLGLAVIHAVLAHISQRAFVLAAVYASLVLFFLIAAGIIAALGVAEQWAGVRARFSRT